MRDNLAKKWALLYSQKIAGREIETTLKHIETMPQHPRHSGLLTALVEYEAEHLKPVKRRK